MDFNLENIKSIINGDTLAKDATGAFTFIEFIKEYGFDNSEEVFINAYKKYLTLYADSIILTTETTTADYVNKNMIEILKSITLTYSSYEEQSFIKNIDWTNYDEIKSIIPFYTLKIREICNFYKQKRNETHLIVSKNAIRGSKKSIEQIIYDKIFDFVFNNKNLLPQMSELQRNLSISIENYVDIYSEYFDIPRDTSLQDLSRGEMLSANMNDVDYKVYLQISQVISDTLYSGKVYLEEIPLIADVALDLSANCVGDMLELKNKLLANSTINLVPLNEQVALKRRLYEKYIGCDLWYLYKDGENVELSLLAKAKNPTGNLLNSGTPDTATTSANDFKLLSHIGLFFKPNKLSFLKINAKDYTWEINNDIVEDRTIYVFPDPTKYGDIGNNKSNDYPIAIYYDLDYDIKGISSGESKNDPLFYIGETGWQSYYSKQQDDFKLIDNTDYVYSFSSLSNSGLLHEYQADIYGNEFGIFKGYNKNVFDYDENNEPIYEITISSLGIENLDYINEINEDEHSNAINFNGGYFEDPYNKNKKFDYDKILTINDSYRWKGISFAQSDFITSPNTKHINFGSFSSGLDIIYTDNYGVVKESSSLDSKYEIIEKESETFISKLESDDNIILIEKTYTSEEIHEQSGILYVKNSFSLYNKPINFWETFSWVNSNNNEKITHVSVLKNNIILETETRFLYIPYKFDGVNFVDNSLLNNIISLQKDVDSLYSEVLYVEGTNKIYIIRLKKYADASIMSFIPIIYMFNCDDYTNTVIFDGENNTGKANMENFELMYSEAFNIGKIIFTYNNSLKMFLLSYLYKNSLDMAFLYEHKFKLNTSSDFLNTIETNVYSMSDSTIVYNSDIDGGIISCSNKNHVLNLRTFFQEV